MTRYGHGIRQRIRPLAGFLAVAGLVIGQAGCAGTTERTTESATRAGAEIGRVDFEASCDPDVRQDFDHALAQMHHMMYAQARAEFEAIAEADPQCAMAHWGIATTRFQPLWPTRPSPEELRQGWREIQRAMELDPAAGTEEMLVKATAAFFRDPETAPYAERIARWAEGMTEAYRANPENPDTAALYGLSRLALAQEAERPGPLLDEAAEVLRAVWEERPNHPGAVHYTIHATDVDGRAENALDIVRSYREIAPRVAHALHMPTHIYVRLGEWPRVIDWNARSAQAALESPVDGAVSHHYAHAMDYLLYANLQQGRDAEARAVLEEALGKDNYQATFISAFHLAAMPARLAVERQDWEQAAALEPGTPEYLPWEETYWPLAISTFARGLGGVHTGDLELASAAESRMKELRDEARAAGEERFATNIEVDRRILAGWIAHARGDDEKAVELMRSAASLEGTVEKDPVTPGALRPPYEALGALLLELQRPQEALQAFERADQVWPGRYRTLLGAARAAAAAGDEAAARKYYGELLAIAEESERPGVREARQATGG